MSDPNEALKSPNYALRRIVAGAAATLALAGVVEAPKAVHDYQKHRQQDAVVNTYFGNHDAANNVMTKHNQPVATSLVKTEEGDTAEQLAGKMASEGNAKKLEGQIVDQAGNGKAGNLQLGFTVAVPTREIDPYKVTAEQPGVLFTNGINQQTEQVPLSVLNSDDLNLVRPIEHPTGGHA